ncbi:MAG: hypothetical protein PUC82_01380 [bacterium]|nr:hypothetical protein [bacterium]
MTIEEQYMELSDEFIEKYGKDVQKELFDGEDLEPFQYEEKMNAMREYADSHPVDDSSDGSDNSTLPESFSCQGDFNGNKIFYNEKETNEAMSKVNDCKVEFSAHLENALNVDTFFESLPAPYKQLSPDPPFSKIKEGIESEIEAAEQQYKGKIEEVVDAIKDYSDGNGVYSDKSTEVLRKWVAFGTNPSGGPGNDSGGGPAVDIVPNDNLESSAENAIADVADDVTSPNDTSLTDDEELSIPNVGNTSTNNGAVFGSAFGAVLADDDIELLGEDIALSDNDISALGDASSRFVVPTLSNNAISTDGIKGSSVVGGAAAVIAAATAAVGGKVYYDKKLTDEDDDSVDSEEKDENDVVDIEHDNDDEVEDVEIAPSEIDFTTTGVKFKESLFNESGEI